MAFADMFLKIPGVTGESSDADHKGEIQLVGWSWGMRVPHNAAGAATGRRSVDEMNIVKRVDKASTTLMGYLDTNKLVSQALLTVRKAGSNPLEYVKVTMERVRVTSVHVESVESELVERVALAFSKVTIDYVPQQDATGAAGGGASTFVTDVGAGG
jgi:type VI secretion system secreted protein Hcp